MEKTKTPSIETLSIAHALDFGLADNRGRAIGANVSAIRQTDWIRVTTRPGGPLQDLRGEFVAAIIQPTRNGEAYQAYTRLAARTEAELLLAVNKLLAGSFKRASKKSTTV